MSDELMTARQVAELLQVRPVTVYAAAAKGIIPSVPLWKGRRRTLLRFRRRDVEAWIESRILGHGNRNRGV